MSFDTSWTDANKVVMAELCKSTGSTEGKQGFRGHVPPMVNVWGFFTGGQGGNEQTTWSPDVVSIHVGARIEAAFLKLEHAEIFTMQVIKALPITNSGNVQKFRIRQGGYSEPRAGYIPVANEKKQVMAWLIDIGCELVFSTGGRL